MYQPKDMFGRPFPLEECKLCVGKGWSKLVEECYNVCVENEIDIAQIKEKFGTLRFYIISGNDKVFNKIDDICARSALICEQCGSSGRTVDLGWYYTLCQSCEKRVSDDRQKAAKNFKDLSEGIIKGET